MKKISEHLGEIIVVLAGVALIVAACFVFRTPIGNFFDSIISKETSVANQVLTSIDDIDVSKPGSEMTQSVNRYNPAWNVGEFKYNASINEAGKVVAGYTKSKFTTPYIKVEPNTTYTVRRHVEESPKLWAYDSAMQPLEAISYTDNGLTQGFGRYTITFTTPADAEYIILVCDKRLFGVDSIGDENDNLESLTTNFESKFMLVYGTEYPLEYVPYGEITDPGNEATALPVYYQAELHDCDEKIDTLNSDDFNVVVISDIHYDSIIYPEFQNKELKILIESVRQIAENPKIDAVLYLGDTIAGKNVFSKERAIMLYNEVAAEFEKVNKPVYWAMGNHDSNEPDYEKESNYPNGHNINHYITSKEWAETWAKSDSPYYKVDFAQKGVRVIMTNTSDYVEVVEEDGTLTRNTNNPYNCTPEQLDKIAEWISQSPFEKVVVASHIPYTPIAEIIKKANDGDTYVNSKGETISFNGNKVIAYLGGDTHNAALEFNTTYNVPVSVVSCASLAESQQNGYAVAPRWITSYEDQLGGRTHERIAGTISETAFEILSINPNGIYKIRFGAGEDKVIAY